MPNDIWLSTSQAAAALGQSERTIRRKCAAGKLACREVSTKGGPAWQVHRDAVARGQPDAASADAAATLSRPGPDVEKLSADVQQIKAYLAGQVNTRESVREDVRAALEEVLNPIVESLEALHAENARLRAALEADQDNKKRLNWLRRFLDKLQN